MPAELLKTDEIRQRDLNLIRFKSLTVL